MTFTFDNSTLIDLALLLAVLGSMWKLSRDVAATEQRVVARIDVLSTRLSALVECVARIEGKLEGRSIGTEAGGALAAPVASLPASALGPGADAG